MAPELYPYGSRGPIGAHYLARPRLFTRIVPVYPTRTAAAPYLVEGRGVPATSWRASRHPSPFMPSKRDTSACIRRHQTFALSPVPHIPSFLDVNGIQRRGEQYLPGPTTWPAGGTCAGATLWSEPVAHSVYGGCTGVYGCTGAMSTKNQGTKGQAMRRSAASRGQK